MQIVLRARILVNHLTSIQVKLLLYLKAAPSGVHSAPSLNGFYRHPDVNGI